MARLAGVELPREKRMEVALTYIYGIGRTRAHETLAATGVSPDLRARDLGDDDLVRLRDWIEANYKVE
ncbi:MAG: 30S ribosomal protein S13, partial [Frankiaceae bacterium]